MSTKQTAVFKALLESGYNIKINKNNITGLVNIKLLDDKGDVLEEESDSTLWGALMLINDEVSAVEFTDKNT